MTFRYGVAAGDLTPTSVVLWTKVEPRARVRWELESEEGEGLTSGITEADASGFVKVFRGGLAPGRPWRYRFHCEEQASTWGFFRTIPTDGPVRFGVVSCAKFNSGYFNAYEALAVRDDLDFVLHLGDYIYEAAQIPRGHQTPGIDIGRPFDPTHDCVTREDYDRRYAQYRIDPSLHRLHENHGMVFTLDDHEIADNAWSGGAQEHLESDGPWADRLRNALSAWEDWQPTIRRPTSDQPIWQSLPLGGAGELFLCDSRLHRTDPSAPDGPAKSILGPDQAHALMSRAAAAQAPWFIVGMPSKFFSLDHARGIEPTDLVLRKLKLATETGGPFPDRWDSYAYERDRLMQHFQRVKTTPVLLCGDVHFAAFSQTEVGDHGIYECVTTSVTSPNLDDKMGWEPGQESRLYANAMVQALDELQWCDLDRHGFMIVDMSADGLVCEWWGVRSVRERSASSDLLHRVQIPTH